MLHSLRSLIIPLVTVVTASAANLITNGDFSAGTTGWDVAVHSGSASGSVVSGAYKVAVNTVGDEFWSINLYQRGLTVEKGQSYELSFDVWADDYRSVGAGVGSVDGSITYGSLGFINAIPTKLSYSLQFTVNGNTNTDAILQFTGGLEKSSFYVDNVVLTKISDRNPEVTITGGPTLNTSDRRPTFTWNGWDDKSISHYFCAIDDDTPNLQQTATSYAPTQDLSVGGHKFYVYAVDNNGNISKTVSQSFTVGNVNDGNLVSNGDFASGTAGWNLAVWGTAAASGQSYNGGYQVNISHVGVNFWDIFLSSPAIRIEQGKEYEVTFQAKADRWRPMCVGVTNAGGNITYGGPGYISVDAIVKTYTYRFTMNQATDNTALVGFTMGTALQNVWIDNVMIRDITPAANTAPTVTITSAPTGATTDRRPTFAWTGSDDGTIATYYCEIDDDTPDYMTSLTSYTMGSPLPLGYHTFYVYAIDNDGNKSPVVSTSFTIEGGAITTTTKPDTVTSVVKADSVVVDSSFVGTAGKEDTVMTKVTFTVYKDSLFTITDSLSDGKWFNADTVFNAVKFRNDTVSTKIDTLKYQGTAIMLTDTQSKAGISDLLVSPNPVAQTAEGVNLIIPSELSGHWKVIVSDALGNLMDEAEFEATGGTTYTWDLHSKYGVRVASGSYVMIAQFTNRDGRSQMFKRMIGVQK